MQKEARIVAVTGVLVGTLYSLVFARLRLDDAYITYRYAENLARGRGFVFNEGERLLGTTSPGHALVAAAAHLVGGHEALPAVMSGLGALAWVTQAFLVYTLARPALGRFVASVAALGIAAGAARSYLFVPLETNLVAALVLGAIALAVRNRWMTAGLVLGAAVVVRADAVLAGMPLVALAIARLHRGAWRPVASFAVLPAAWGAFALAYFGSVLPHTLRAKAHVTPALTYATHIAKLPAALLPLTHGGDSLAAGVALWALAIAGWALAVSLDRRLAVLPAWGALHVAAYLVLLPDIAFEWHLYPVSLVAAVGVLFALGWALARLAVPLGIAAAAALTGMLAWNTGTFWSESPTLYWYGARDAMYREVAAFLRTRAQPGDLVDAEEVGTLAYYSDLPMLDHAGLVTAFALAARGGTEGAEVAADHCRALASLPRLRFVVMNRFEVDAHRCLFEERAPLAHFHRPALHDFERPPLFGDWSIWVADRREGTPVKSAL